MPTTLCKPNQHVYSELDKEIHTAFQKLLLVCSNHFFLKCEPFISLAASLCPRPSDPSLCCSAFIFLLLFLYMATSQKRSYFFFSLSSFPTWQLCFAPLSSLPSSSRFMIIKPSKSKVSQFQNISENFI